MVYSQPSEIVFMVKSYPKTSVYEVRIKRVTDKYVFVERLDGKPFNGSNEKKFIKNTGEEWVTNRKPLWKLLRVRPKET